MRAFNVQAVHQIGSLIQFVHFEQRGITDRLYFPIHWRGVTFGSITSQVVLETGEKMTEKRKKHQTGYFRLTIIYTNGGFPGRVFKSRENAEKYTAKQIKSPVVKKTKVERIIKNRHDGVSDESTRLMADLTLS